jgi:hypothetical protein
MGDTHRDTEGFTKYAVEMSSGDMMYILFRKNWFRHSKVNRGDIQTHGQHGDLISLLLLFLNKENGLNMFSKRQDGN